MDASVILGCQRGGPSNAEKRSVFIRTQSGLLTVSRPTVRGHWRKHENCDKSLISSFDFLQMCPSSFGDFYNNLGFSKIVISLKIFKMLTVTNKSASSLSESLQYIFSLDQYPTWLNCGSCSPPATIPCKG